MTARTPWLWCALLATPLAGSGCRFTGRLLQGLLEERPPAPLRAFSVASDVRIDSTGMILGSFVGEGTPRQFHLLSSDTTFIAELLRRYRPDLGRRADLWQALARERTVSISPQPAGDSGDGRPRVGEVPVASAFGRGPVTLDRILLRGSRCGWRGSQAELIVGESTGRRRLRGPVVASFLRPTNPSIPPGYTSRPPLEPPSDSLTLSVIARTRSAMDLILSAGFVPRELPVALAPAAKLEVNTLEDIDVADVIPFRADDNRIRLAVSLRERRVGVAGDTVLAATVMVWDSAGVWRQTVFRPTLLDLRRGRLTPRGGDWLPLYWRRLEALSALAHPGDYLWMEQVDIREATVLWGIIDPRSNTTVAAAEVAGPCLQ